MTGDPSRFSVVNGVLAAAFGLPGRRLLRPGQTVADWTAADRTRLLGQLARRYPVTRDGFGALVVGDAPLVAGGGELDLEAGARLAAAQAIAAALAPILATLEDGLREPGAGADVGGAIERVRGGLDALLRALGDDEPAPLARALVHDLLGDPGFDGLRWLRELASDVDETGAVRGAALLLRRQIVALETLDDELAHGPDAAPLFEQVDDIGACARSMAEVIGETLETAEALGVDACDWATAAIRVELAHGGGLLPLDRVLGALSDGWQRLADLADTAGSARAVMQHASRLDLLGEALRGVTHDRLAETLGLAEGESRRLANRLRRVVTRNRGCLQPIADALSRERAALFEAAAEAGAEPEGETIEAPIPPRRGRAVRMAPPPGDADPLRS